MPSKPTRQPGRSTAAATGPAYVGWTVVDQRGRRIGTVQSVHCSGRTGHPEWITVCDDRWATAQHIAPLAGSTIGDRELRLPFDASTVRGAPPITAADQMDVADQHALYSYYLQKLGPHSHE